jgi:LemA protein
MEIAAIAAALVAAWGVRAYNRLVRLGNRVREAWSGIDVQLKRRHDLVPNLVAVVSAYAQHEYAVLADVTRARTQAADDLRPGERQHHENRLSNRLQALIAVAERYPQLLADESFAELHEQLVETENQLQMARRYYNGSVRDNNIGVESFPSNLVARMLGFEIEPFFEIATTTDRRTPAVRIAS